MDVQNQVSIYSEDKVRLIRLVHMACTDARDVLFQIYKWGTTDKDPALPLDEFLINKLEYPSTKVRNSFSADQRELMKTDPLGTSFDVTMLGKAVTFACQGLRRPKKVLWVPTELEYRLTSLVTIAKDFRNKVAHRQPFSVGKQQFDTLTNELLDLLKETLEVGAEFFGVDKDECRKLVRITCERLNKSRDDRLENQDITNYENSILLHERQQILCSQGKTQLKEKYSVFSHVSPVSFLTETNIHMSVNLIYTHMEINESGPSDENNLIIDYSDILEYTQKATITNGSKTDVLLIEGIAGAGKTTLTRLIMSEWRADSSPLQHLLDYDLLIYYECRNSVINSFTQLLETLMPDVILRFKEGDLMKCVLSLKLLIIADGLDELNKSSKQVMKEILDIGTLAVVTIICTSRPESVREFYSLVHPGQHVTHLKIKGIPKDKRIEFVEKYHRELENAGFSNKKTEGLSEYLKKTSRYLEEPLRLPLNLAWLTIMWCLAPEKMNNVKRATELYTEILRLNKKSLERKLENTANINHTSDELDKKLHRFILHLSWEALISLKEKTLDSLPHNSVKRLKDACSSLGLPHERILGAFLVESITFTEARTKSTFRFAHKGEQDYLAANYLIEVLNGQDLRFDMTNITRAIESHPSFQNESVRPDFIEHIMNCLVSYIPSATEQKYSLCRLEKCGNAATSANSLVPITIHNVFEGLYGANKIPSDLSRYQNMLQYAAGLLHRVPKTTRQNIANEIVSLFKKSGVIDKDQWLDFISETECDENVLSSVASQQPSLINGANIKDSRMYIYSKLLPHSAPEKVKVSVAEKEDKNLENLIAKLADKTDCTVEIYLHFYFRDSEATTSSTVDARLQQLLESCSVRKFMGRLSEENAALLPRKSERLWVRLDRKNARAMSEVLSDLPTRAPAMEVLDVHVARTTDPKDLTPLNLTLKVDLTLYLSDVGDSSVDWACDVAQRLQPTGTKNMYNVIKFPRCQLTTEGFEGLLQEAKSQGIRVSPSFLGTVVVSSPNIPRTDFPQLEAKTRQVLGCYFRLNEEAEIWPKIIK